MAEPSNKAIEAAAMGWGPESETFAHAKAFLNRAYPIIRADVIAEIVEGIRCGMGDPKCPWQGAADFIERKFGGEG